VWAERVARGQEDLSDSAVARLTVPPRAGFDGFHDATVALDIGGMAIDVVIEDSDALRCHVAPNPSPMLSVVERSRWSSGLRAAWRLLASKHRGWAGGIASVIGWVVPQHEIDPGRHVSASSTDAFGMIGLSFTEDTPTLAVAMLHEVQHLKLGALLDAVRVHNADQVARHFAPWRGELRPFDAFLQGTYAFAGVTDFWRVQVAHEPDANARLRAMREYSSWRRHALVAIDSVRSSGLLTDAGRAFVEGIVELSAGWVPLETTVDDYAGSTGRGSSSRVVVG
jgi:HEXXH motif-containing protein